MTQIIIQNNNGGWDALELGNYDVVLSKQLSDLSEPATIECGYSIGVKLPFTEHNNSVLGLLFGFDVDTNASVAFDMRAKTKFKLLNNGAIMYEGNFVMDNIVRNTSGGGNYYAVTLYDELADVFQKMDYTISEPAPSVDGGDDARNIQSMHIQLTPNYVKTDWETGTTGLSILDTNDECQIDGTNAHSVLGFLPTERKWDNFAYDKLIFAGLLTGLSNPDVSQSYRAMLGDGFPNEFSDNGAQSWKTYHLKPYVYIKPLWEFIAAEIKRVTNYRVVFDGLFFEMSNPFWTRLLYTCHYIDRNTDNAEMTARAINTNVLSSTTPNFIKQMVTDVITPNTLDVIGMDTTVTGYMLHAHIDMDLLFKINAAVNGLTYQLSRNNYLRMEFDVHARKSDDTYTNMNAVTRVIYVCSENYSGLNDLILQNGAESVVIISGATITDGNLFRGATNAYIGMNDARVHYVLNGDVVPPVALTSGFDVQFYINGSQFVDVEEIGLQVKMRNEYADDITDEYIGGLSVTRIDGTRIIYNRVEMKLTQRADFPVVTWLNLLGDDWNVQREFCRLLKIFGLLARLDTNAREIHLISRGEYFAGWRDKLVDWTKRVHMENGIEMTDVLADTNKMLYTYDKSDSPHDVRAVNETGHANNTVVLNLPYENENGETDVVEGMNNSSVASIANYYFADCANNILQHRTKSPDVYYDNNANGEAMDDRIGQLLFRRPNNINGDSFAYTDGDISFGGLTATIAGDTAMEIANDEYANHGFTGRSNVAVMTKSYPNFGYTYNQYGCEWKIGLYDAFHARWNDIIYNRDNRLYDCEITMEYDEYVDFDFNHLVTIDNNIYLCLAVKEYALNNRRARVRLVRLGNPSLMDNINAGWRDDYLLVSPNIFVTRYGSNSFVIGVTSTAAWTATRRAVLPWWISAVSLSAMSGNAGTTQIVVTVNSNVHTAKSQEYIYTFQNSAGETATLSVINAADDATKTDTITITPNIQVTPNAFGQIVATQINIQSISPWKYQIHGGNVIDASNVIASCQANRFQMFDRQLTLLNLLSQTGNTGDTQTITFTNQSGHTATFRWQRGESHNVYISTGNVQNWDYTTEPNLENRESQMPFTLRCDFDFIISQWQGTMYDSDTDEQCFGRESKVFLTDIDRNITYTPDDTFEGHAGETYNLEWEYGRRFRQYGDSRTHTYFLIQCVNDSFVYLVEIFCNTLNNH